MLKNCLQNFYIIATIPLKYQSVMSQQVIIMCIKLNYSQLHRRSHGGLSIVSGGDETKPHPHAPVINRTITSRPQSPWFNNDCREAKQHLRRLERHWRSTGLEIDHQIFVHAAAKYNKTLLQARREYYSLELEDCGPREFFRKVDRLCQAKSTKTLPKDDNSSPSLADRFCTFFANKTEKIVTSLHETSHREIADIAFQMTDQRFEEFHAVTEDQVHRVLSASKSTTCGLDPIPSDLLKKCSVELIPFFTKIVNLSLTNGYFPDTLKFAHISPLLKSDKLDPEVLKSYRPIAHLKFLGKLLERLMVSQMQDYLMTNNLFATAQSAYRPHHSCETAIVRVVNDILLALDRGNEAILLLLDYTGAFDTISQQMLVSRLEERYGFTRNALKLIASYLKSRSHCVVIGDSKSQVYSSTHGVPQGSVIGPLAFTLYSAPLQDIISHHNLNCMMYADDTQVYVFIEGGRQNDAIQKLQACISDIKHWSVHNCLKLNADKTEVLHFTSKFRQSHKLESVTLDEGVVNTIADSARNLGVKLDKHLTLNYYINDTCRAASFALHKIGTIRQFLNRKATERLVHAHVMSRIDFCNSILYGLPDMQINKLQRIQNSAARLVTHAQKYDHITPILYELHWLPIKVRIQYKILSLTFLSLQGLGPTYLQDLIQRYHPARNLRSKSKSLLVCPPTVTKFYGARTFAVASAELWNSLPDKIKDAETIHSFRRMLKTYLFLQ